MPKKIFGRRNAPDITPPATVMNAPEGLGGPAPLPPSRMRSFAVALTAAGLAALAALAFTQRKSCGNEDWSDKTDSPCRSSSSSSGAHFNFFSRSGGGSGTPSTPHGASFGGFGGTGASGLHAGGGHGGGGS